MVHGIQQLLDGQTVAFTEGRFHDIAALCDEPIALQIEDRYIAFKTREAFARGLERYHRHLRRRHVAHIGCTVGAIEIPRRGRFRCWVDWTHDDSRGRSLGICKAILYGRNTADALAVEMVQFTSFSFPEITRLLPMLGWTG